MLVNDQSQPNVDIHARVYPVIVAGTLLPCIAMALIVLLPGLDGGSPMVRLLCVRLHFRDT